ncbi:MAG: transposase [bacterium]|nr:transposase [bacterium]
MNYRDYKKFSEGGFYHIYNRGNNKQDIFFDDEDRKCFLFRTREALYPEFANSRRRPLAKGAFTLLSYCLMPNHFHLLIRQNLQNPISDLIKKVCTGYSKYFNKKYERVGHVFQDQYKAIVVSQDNYLTWVSAYIHQNPKIAGLVENLEEYPWSSYRDYLGLRQGKLCSIDLILGMFKNGQAYKEFVEDSFDQIKIRKDVQKLLLE